MGHNDRFEPLGSGRKAQIYTLQPLVDAVTSMMNFICRGFKIPR